MLQQAVVLACQFVKYALQAGQVGGGFGQRTAELLQRGETVEFQRIEGRVALVLLALVARHDLRFGFQVQATQLVVQAGVGAVQLGHGAAESTQLLFQARTVDRHFAGVVDQAVEQVGANAHLFLCHVGRSVVVAEQHALQRCRQWCKHHGRRSRTTRGAIGIAAGLASLLARMRALFEFGDEFGRHRCLAVCADLGHQAMQSIEATFQQFYVVAVKINTLRRHLFQQRFDCVAQVADGVDASHACATLDGVQVTLQAGDQRAVFGVVAQLGQQSVGMVEQVVAFLDEDIDQVAVQFGEVQRVVGQGGCRCCECSGLRCGIVAACLDGIVGACCFGFDRVYHPCLHCRFFRRDFGRHIDAINRCFHGFGLDFDSRHLRLVHLFDFHRRFGR